MWLRMEAVISACCKGYFVALEEYTLSTLLDSFAGVLGPSNPGRYLGMEYAPQDVLKELAVSVMCGNWDITGTSYTEDKDSVRAWARNTTRTLEQDTAFVTKTEWL